MPKLKVVLDACVLIPQYLRDTLLSVAWKNLYLPFWSDIILDEVERNLIVRYHISPEKAKTIVVKMASAFPEASMEVSQELIKLMTNHPKDRHVLATAVMAKAEVIVTNNLADFPSEVLTSWAITALSPDDFLTNLFNEYPDDIALIVQQQSQKYQSPPKSTLELLDFLGRKANLPKFASLALAYFQ